MNYELLAIFLYIASFVVIGFILSSRIKTDDDYFLAGRSLGPWASTFSIFATWFGAEACVGTAGGVFRHGLSGTTADPFGYTLCLVLMGFLFARGLYRKNITTVADLLKMRYGPIVEKITVLLLVPSSLLWAGAQIRAFGQVLGSVSTFSFTLSITVAFVVVVLYTIFGGLLADAISDFVQGLILIAGLVALFVIIAIDQGGVGNVLGHVDPRWLSFTPPDGPAPSFFDSLEHWMVPIIGSVTAQELISRVVASKSESVARNSTFRAAGIYAVFGLIPIFIGLSGTLYFTNLDEAESVMPLMAKAHLPYWFYVLFIGALVSAILSTVDSTLLAIGGLVSHNIVFPIMGTMTEERKVVVARIGVFFSGLIAYIIAFFSTGIIELVESASAIGGTSLFVAVFCALFVKRGGPFEAIVSMIVGSVVWLVLLLQDNPYPFMISFVAAFATYFGLAWLPHSWAVAKRPS